MFVTYSQDALRSKGLTVVTRAADERKERVKIVVINLFITTIYKTHTLTHSLLFDGVPPFPFVIKD